MRRATSSLLILSVRITPRQARRHHCSLVGKNARSTDIVSVCSPIIAKKDLRWVRSVKSIGSSQAHMYRACR